MEVILLKDVDKLGAAHDLVTVKNGYGRNYLIPQGLALIANKKNRNVLNERKRIENIHFTRMLGAFKAIEEKLNGAIVKVGAKAGTSGKIFGSVTNIQIANAIKDQFSIEIDRKKITILEEVKNLGTYTAQANLHPEVQPKITFEVYAD